MHIGTRVVLVSVGLISLATLLVIVESPNPPEHPRIVFGPGAAVQTPIVCCREFPIPEAGLQQHWYEGFPNLSVSELLPPAQISRVRVARYSSACSSHRKTSSTS
jgi:hypothetical protein